jgi:phosphoglycerol transferase MdoB-like AlkP superfamily enzyme
MLRKIERFLRQQKLALWSAFSVLVVHEVFGIVSRWQISMGALVTDFILLTYFVACFLRFQKRQRLGAILFTVLAIGLFLVVDLKYIYHQEWLKISEFLLAEEAFTVFSPVLSVTVAFLIIAIVLGVIKNLQTRYFLSNLLFVLPVIAFGIASVLVPNSTLAVLDYIHAYKTWEGNNFFQKGVVFGLLYDIPRTLVLKARLDQLKHTYTQNTAAPLSVSPTIQQRNVHLFVMESFMDPIEMGLQLATDPMDPRMRNWLGGYALSPGYGGQTAQAEFELLCGTPAYELADSIVFNNLGGRPIACLPHLLEQFGYMTISTVAARRSFYNYGNAYQSMGFSKRLFEDSFPGKDKDGIWISNDEHVVVNKATIMPLLQSHTPIFNYMLTSSGHINYDLNKKTRPRVLTTPFDDQITQMVNNVYYNSRTIADYVDYLCAHDPQAIIVVIGDHQGSLQHFNPVERCQTCTNEAEALSKKFSVPYLFLDAGKKQEFGLITPYEIPHLILASLTGELYHRLAQQYGVDLIRPLPSKTLYASGSLFGLCPNQTDPSCSRLEAFQEQTMAILMNMVEKSQN